MRSTIRPPEDKASVGFRIGTGCVWLLFKTNGAAKRYLDRVRLAPRPMTGSIGKGGLVRLVSIQRAAR